MGIEPNSISWVLTEDDLTWFLASLGNATQVVMDLETTGLDEHATFGGLQNGGVPAEIVLGAFTVEDEDSMRTWVLPGSHPDSPWCGLWREVWATVANTLLEFRIPLINHNLKFDVRYLTNCTGVSLVPLMEWDTLIAAHLLDENRSNKLKALVPTLFEVERWDDFDLSKPGAAREVPLFDLGYYAAQDTYWTWRLAALQVAQMYRVDDGDLPMSEEEIENAKLGKLMVWCSLPSLRALTRMEEVGFRFDGEWALSRVVELEQTEELLRAELVSLYDCEGLRAGTPSFAPTSRWFRAWAEAAVEAGDLKVAAMTANGNPQWTKGVLTRQARAGSKVAQTLLDLRQASKHLEFLRSWLEYETAEGTIHTTYNAGSVVTGRLSSSGPNMQQVTAALRPAFVPREGCVFVDLDYSQVELRVAAFISRSEPMLQAFREGKDLHSMLAARITGKELEDVTPVERQAGKSANFGLLYGMGSMGFREYAETQYGVSFTIEEADSVRTAFFDMWEGIRQWHDRAGATAREHGSVRSPIGRVRRLPGIWSADDHMASYAARSAINSPVQGFASDLMQIAAASIMGVLPGHEAVPGATVVGTVHDSIVIECPKDEWRSVGEACRERMLGVGEVLKRLDCDLDVPLAADAKVGTRWGLADVGKL